MVEAFAATDPTVTERVAFLRNSERWTWDAMTALQVRELRRVLGGAARDVPYYKALFARLGFDPSTIRDPRDVQSLPLIDKEILRDRHSEFISRAAPKAHRLHMTTGGSTGDPLKIMMDAEFKAKNHANTIYYMGLWALLRDPTRASAFTATLWTAG